MRIQDHFLFWFCAGWGFADIIITVLKGFL